MAASALLLVFVCARLIFCSRSGGVSKKNSSHQARATQILDSGPLNLTLFAFSATGGAEGPVVGKSPMASLGHRPRKGKGRHQAKQSKYSLESPHSLQVRKIINWLAPTYQEACFPNPHASNSSTSNIHAARKQAKTLGLVVPSHADYNPFDAPFPKGECFCG